jgi:ribosomal protein S18 acetylase RimI-like enzyme
VRAVPEVRPATRGDVAACLSLWLAERGGDADIRRERLVRDVDESERLLVVASLAGELVGYGRATRFEPPEGAPREVAPRGYYLIGLVVAPSARRRGVGRALTEARLAWIGARAGEAWYFANARNVGSLELHRKLGFVEVTRTFWYPEVSFDGGEGILCRVTLPPWS